MNTLRQQIRNCLLTATTGLLLAAGPVTAVAKNDNQANKRVSAAVRGNGADKIDVIVRYKQMPDQAQNDHARGLGAKIYKSYGQLPMRAMRLPARAVEALSRSKGIEFISADSPVEAFSQTARETAQLPLAGSADYVSVNPNIGVAVLDSGVAGSHRHERRFAPGLHRGLTGR